jgi:excisionase family DNA binding protein
VALRAHLRRLRSDGVPPPADLEELAERLLPRSGAVSSGQERSESAVPSSSGESDPMLRTTEAARQLGVSPSTIRRRVAAGDLAVVRIGRAVRFRTSDLQKFGEKGTTG